MCTNKVHTLEAIRNIKEYALALTQKKKTIRQHSNHEGLFELKPPPFIPPHHQPSRHDERDYGLSGSLLSLRV